MRIDPEEFLALMAAVEAGGGQLLPDLCEPTKLRLEQPTAAGEMRPKDIFTTGCGDESRFVIPYDVPAGREGKRQRKHGAGFVTACAYDDRMDLWPRFLNAAEALQ